MSKRRLWAGRVISALTVVFLLMDAIMKVVKARVAVEATTQLGYPANVVLPIGIVLLVCTLLYAISRTAIFGAVLLTGYLGGAIATNVRVDAPLFSHILFPVYVAVMAWGGLYMRDSRLRALISSNN